MKLSGKWKTISASLLCCAVTVPLSTAAHADFGMQMQDQLHAESASLFGVQSALTESAQNTRAREPGQNAYDLVILAGGLNAKILTRNAGDKADMFSMWPNESSPTHAVFCIEGGVETIGTFDNGQEKLNPSVQAIDLNDGEVTTLLRGMSRCDGIRTTAWGTILATEEASDGQAYEIISPLEFSNHTVTHRAAGTIVDQSGVASTFVAKRDALPTMAWEGLMVLDSGVVIAGDELRPGTDNADADGGAIFKFIPSGTTGGIISNLAASPLTAGSVFAMQTSCRDNQQQYGQGCEIGNAAWLPVSAENARSDADALGATGYYRPEDLHKDPIYAGEGVRFCWANTGNEGASNYGEVICGIDSMPAFADADTRTVIINRFVEGDTQFNAMDNLAFQPITGNLYVIEDHSNGDVFACLPDGADRDIKTDGCIRIMSVKDQSAEPSGFEFLGDGKSAIVAIQHSNDDLMPSMDDYRTDDIILITGFQVADGGASTGEQSSGGNVRSVTGARYDDTQGEIFWDRGAFIEFNIYRDGVLQTETPNAGNSFFQSSLTQGTSYSYEVRAITDSGEVTIGSVDI